MNLVQLSDSHLFEPGAHENAEARIENLRAAVAAANDLAEPVVDAVIHTGDMVHTRAPGEYALAREILERLTAPLYVIPGNRDCRESLRRHFGADGYMTGNGDEPIVYAVDDYPVRLIGFDTQSGVGHEGVQADIRKGDVDAERLDWLDRTLAERPNAPTVLFMHHPPIDITTSQYPWQYVRREAETEIAAVLSRHKQILRIFCGHSHREFSSPICGIPVRTMPSVAVDLRLGEFTAEQEDRPLITLHRFGNAGGVESEAVAAAMRPDHIGMSGAA